MEPFGGHWLDWVIAVNLLCAEAVYARLGNDPCTWPHQRERLFALWQATGFPPPDALASARALGWIGPAIGANGMTGD
jgi:hypothetical protein